MNSAKKCWMIIILAAFHGHAAADVVTYVLDDVILADGEPIVGTFDWTFDVGDFEGGSGEFTALEIPYTVYSFADGNLNIDIQTNSIEISGNGNYHDVGLDITLDLPQPFAPTESVSIDLDLSFFECCGNGFHDQFFQSGSIAPTIPLPSCDFTGDNLCNITDLDLMHSVGPISPGVPAVGNEEFDLNGDGSIDLEDRDQWLVDAASQNGLGSPYKLGDANLDGAVDGLDFIAWNGSKFTASLPWSKGNFNGDAVIDGPDFILWNANKFTSSDGGSAVPEPGTASMAFVAILLLAAAKRR